MSETGRTPLARRRPIQREAFGRGTRRTGAALPGALALLLLRDPHRGLAELARRRGDVAAARVGPRRIVLVSHPRGVRHVLATDHEPFTKGSTLGGLRVLLGEGLITSEGAAHAAQRRALQGHLGRGHEGAWQRGISAATARCAASWHDGAELELQAEMLRLSLDVTTRTLFDDILPDDELPRLARATGTISEISSLTSLPWLEAWVRTPLRPFRRFRAARAELRAWAGRVLAGHPRPSGTSLLDDLARASTEGTGDPVDQALTLLMAAHVTTGHALAWALYRVAGDARVAERLAAEATAQLTMVDDHLGTDPAAEPPALPYARAVFAETLRLHPPAWAIGREAARATSVDGCPIGHGDMVLLSPWVTQHDERWFAEPSEFRPERWLDGEAISSRFSFFPFGLGPRRCLGEPLAWSEGTLVLARLARDWRFERLGPPEPRLRSGVTLAAREGLRARARTRRTKDGSHADDPVASTMSLS